MAKNVVAKQWGLEVIDGVRDSRLPTSSWPLNWPNVQGGYNISGSLSSPGNMINDPWRERMAKKDLVVFQGLFDGSSNRTSYISGLTWMRSNYPNGKRIFIHNPGEVKKVSPWSGGQARQKAALDTLGSFPNDWILQNAAGDYKSASFSPVSLWKCNEASHLLPTNGSGDTYAEAYTSEYKSWTDVDSLTSVLDGAYHDVAAIMAQQTYDSTGLVRDDSRDYNLDGTDDPYQSNTVGATDDDDGGSVMYRKGVLTFLNEFKAQYGSSFIYAGNGGRDGITYTDSGIGPLPINGAANQFYQQWDFRLFETANTSVGLDYSGSDYVFDGGSFSLGRFYNRAHICLTSVKPDSTHPLGRGFVMVEFRGITRAVTTDMAYTSADWAFYRAGWALSLLEERFMPCPGIQGYPVFLDESVVDLGDPVGTRSMGTLDLDTGGFTLRDPDSGNFFWQEFDNALIVFNGNTPTVGAVWPQATTDTVTLPDPGVGKKWQRLDASTYSNGVTGFSCEGQDTTTNSGADVGATLSLRRFHGLLLLRVDA